MKVFSLFIAVLSLVAGSVAVGLQKQVIITYPTSTPDWVVNQAKDAIVQAGGVITHEYHLIKGFAATAGEKVIETVQAMGSKYQALVEEDRVVSVQ
ncbi:Proteinase inhibitor, propeptide [Niveomyces insectorum RCEF 264]|uniref:Proteinase inhibitor, propeptide n=1 Tax=Niveomyces insectorum RCEF 264 TaxID=1081102 RepID=A0A167QSW2_9HYPO|nr:Proteinase inhibitor, propeptide [Niveomyces insectorum RCEF 264]